MTNKYDYELPTFNPKVIEKSKLTDKEKRKLFGRICNLDDWKSDIEAMIPADRFDDYNEAVCFVTGGGLEIVYEGTGKYEGMIGVTGYGYYHHMGDR